VCNIGSNILNGNNLKIEFGLSCDGKKLLNESGIKFSLEFASKKLICLLKRRYNTEEVREYKSKIIAFR